MATIKAYTDLEQSKKLAEILPLESADQIWERFVIAGANLDVPDELQYKHSDNIPLSYCNGIPCWSLAALLQVLPEVIIKSYYDLQKENSKYFIVYFDDTFSCEADNIVDACADMIERLHKQNLL